MSGAIWPSGGCICQRYNRQRLPLTPTWKSLFNQHDKEARREAVGVVTEGAKLEKMLRQGYWLTNWDDDGCALFNPPPMNGLAMYVSKPLAEKHRRVLG